MMTSFSGKVHGSGIILEETPQSQKAKDAEAVI